MRLRAAPTSRWVAAHSMTRREEGVGFDSQADVAILTQRDRDGPHRSARAPGRAQRRWHPDSARVGTELGAPAVGHRCGRRRAGRGFRGERWHSQAPPAHHAVCNPMDECHDVHRGAVGSSRLAHRPRHRCERMVVRHDAWRQPAGWTGGAVSHQRPHSHLHKPSASLGRAVSRLARRIRRTASDLPHVGRRSPQFPERRGAVRLEGVPQARGTCHVPLV